MVQKKKNNYSSRFKKLVTAVKFKTIIGKYKRSKDLSKSKTIKKDFAILKKILRFLKNFLKVQKNKIVKYAKSKNYSLTVSYKKLYSRTFSNMELGNILKNNNFDPVIYYWMDKLSYSDLIKILEDFPKFLEKHANKILKMTENYNFRVLKKDESVFGKLQNFIEINK